MKFGLSTFLLSLLFAGSVLAGSFDETDPLVGKWIWHGGSIATFRPNGTAINGGGEGTWIFNKNPEVQRKYRFVWSEGRIVDKAILSEDRSTLQIQNNRGIKFTARRPATMP